VIATITRARNTEEETLLLDSLSALSNAHLAVYAADGGSRREFVDRLAQLPGFEVTTAAGGLVAQVKTALAKAAAAGAEFVLYTEPDKRDFFQAGLPLLLERARRQPETSLVVAARDGISLRTFPDGQRRMEMLFNDLASGFGLHGDLLYGPLTLRPEVVSRYLAAVPDDLGWGWRPYIMARCLADGLSVDFYEAAFPCPAGQRGEDDADARLYRLEQLAQNVRGLHLGLKDGRR
jgi:hypothetical protein